MSVPPRLKSEGSCKKILFHGDIFFMLAGICKDKTLENIHLGGCLSPLYIFLQLLSLGQLPVPLPSA